MRRCVFFFSANERSEGDGKGKEAEGKGRGKEKGKGEREREIGSEALAAALPLAFAIFFPFCQSFPSNFPFPFSLPLPFPSSSFPSRSLRPFVCTKVFMSTFLVSEIWCRSDLRANAESLMKVSLLEFVINPVKKNLVPFSKAGAYACEQCSAWEQ